MGIAMIICFLIVPIVSELITFALKNSKIICIVK